MVFFELRSFSLLRRDDSGTSFSMRHVQNVWNSVKQGWHLHPPPPKLGQPACPCCPHLPRVCRCALWQRAACSPVDLGNISASSSCWSVLKGGVQSCTAGWVCIESGGSPRTWHVPHSNCRHCWSSKDFPILCCLNLCLNIVYNKWIIALLSLMLALFIPKERMYWALNKCLLKFISLYGSEAPPLAVFLPGSSGAPLVGLAHTNTCS